MAGLENINEVVGKKVWDDFDKLLSQLDASAAKMLETAKVFKNNPISIGGSGSTKDDVAYIKQLVQAQKEYQNITAQVTKTDKDAAIVQKNLAKARLDNAKAAEIEAKTLQRHTKISQQNAAATQSNMEYARSHTLVITNDTQAVLSNAEAQRLLSEAQAREALIAKEAAEATAAYNAQEKIQVAETAKVVTEKEIAIAAAAEDAAVTKAATIAHAEYNKTLQETTVTTGGAISGIKGIWSGLRQLAYILPGIGIAGIFDLAIAGVIKLSELLRGTKKNVDILADAEKKAARDREIDLKNATKFQKEYSDAVQESIKSNSAAYAKEDAQLKILYGSATNVNLSLHDRLQAIKELQDKYPEYFGNLTNEAILTGNAKAAYDELNGALVKRISLQVYQDELELLVKQNHEIQKQIDKTNVRKNTNGKYVIDETEGELSYQQLLEKRNALADLQVQNSNEQKNILQQIYSLESQLSKLLADRDKPKAKKETDQVSEIYAAQKRLSDAQRDAKVEELNRNITINQSIFDDERNTIEKRTEAYAEMYVSRLQLASLNRDKELEDIQNWFNLYQGEIDKANAIEESKRTEHQKALLVDYEAYTERKIAIDNKYRSDVADINAGVEKDYIDSLINQDQIKKQIGEQGVEDAKRFLKQIRDAEADDQKERDKKDAERLRKARELREALFDIAKSGVYALGGIIEGENQREQDQTDQKKDKIDAYYDEQKKKIEGNGKTQQENEQALADLETERNNQKRQADRDQAIRNRNLAIQQKGIAITNIILNTAEAVSKALPNIPLSIAAGVAGAAQLATAIAQPIPPIPAYKDGTEFHPGGKGLVGDGYVAEWIKEPGKNGYWSPSTPTIMDLPRGTSVTNPEQLAAMATRDAMRTLGMSNKMINESMYAHQMIKSFEALIGETKGVKKAIGNKPINNTVLTEKGLRHSQKRGNSWTTYIDASVRN